MIKGEGGGRKKKRKEKKGEGVTYLRRRRMRDRKIEEGGRWGGGEPDREDRMSRERTKKGDLSEREKFRTET